jgi:hypothetical protein
MIYIYIVVYRDYVCGIVYLGHWVSILNSYAFVAYYRSQVGTSLLAITRTYLYGRVHDATFLLASKYIALKCVL